MKAEDLINKHLTLEGGSDLAITDGRIYNAFLNAVKEAINYTHCCTELKCGDCDCKIKYENIGCDTLKDCKKEW